MAVPASFEESNEVVSPPPGISEVQSLSVLRSQFANGTPCLVSCWKLSAAELEEIKRTKRVWLAVLGTGMPPCFVAGEKPFETAEAET
jgi:hypothetical protein